MLEYCIQPTAMANSNCYRFDGLGFCTLSLLPCSVCAFFYFRPHIRFWSIRLNLRKMANLNNGWTLYIFEWILFQEGKPTNAHNWTSDPIDKSDKIYCLVNGFLSANNSIEECHIDNELNSGNVFIAFVHGTSSNGEWRAL